MYDKNTAGPNPGVGCDVTNCKYNTVDCKCNAARISVQNEKASTKAKPIAPPSPPEAPAESSPAFAGLHICFEKLLKCVYYVIDSHFSALFPVRGIDLDHVKAGLQIPFAAGQIQLGSGKNSLLLGIGDKFPGLCEFSIFSRLNLSKNYEFSLFRNNIKLSSAAGKVTFQDAVAVKAQVAGGLLLPPGSQTFSIHQCIFLRKLGRWMGQGPYLRIAS